MSDQLTPAPNDPPPGEEFCPACGKPVSRRDVSCPHCGTELEEPDQDRRPRRSLDVRKKGGPEATEFLIPTNVSPWAIGSCYLGAVSLCLPFIGLLFAALAIFFGILALATRRKRGASYGSVTSDIRTIIGLVCGTLGLLLWGTALVLVFMKP
jgi:hypothetical protein